MRGLASYVLAIASVCWLIPWPDLWPATVAAIVVAWVIAGPGLDSWDRVEFDVRNYSRLRNSGLTRKETTAELDRLWNNPRPDGGKLNGERGS